MLAIEICKFFLLCFEVPFRQSKADSVQVMERKVLRRTILPGTVWAILHVVDATSAHAQLLLDSAAGTRDAKYTRVKTRAGSHNMQVATNLSRSAFNFSDFLLTLPLLLSKFNVYLYVLYAEWARTTQANRYFRKS